MKSYHIAPQFIHGNPIGTSRNGAREKGHILSVLSREGDYHLVSLPDGTVRQKIHIADAGLTRQALEEHSCGL